MRKRPLVRRRGRPFAYSEEVRKNAVSMLMETDEGGNARYTILEVAAKIGVPESTLRYWMPTDEAESSE
jgi:transposase-like protein